MNTYYYQFLTIKGDNMELQYICTVCGHVHDEATEGKFEELSDLFTCPECGCFKDEYYSIPKEKQN